MTQPPLPHLTSPLAFLTEGGIETSLLFQRGIDLPHFASFPLLATEHGRNALLAAYRPYLAVAKRFGTGIILETPTWRANGAWIATMDLPADTITEANFAAVKLLQLLRDEEPKMDILVSGCLGPLADAYQPPSGEDSSGENMLATATATATASYAPQVEALASAGADLLCLMTTTSRYEAIAAARLAHAAGLQICISFTVETDGHLLSGLSAAEFITAVDAATEGHSPCYYGINCAHPVHLLPALQGMDAKTRDRIRSLRANASQKSHAELDESTSLDRGVPCELAEWHKALKELVPGLKVVGGCCGTDEEHVLEIAKALFTEQDDRES